jgi:hypothetical protein
LLSPILVRPVREQLEHDRIIRLLQVKCRRRYEAGMNPGSEQNAAVGSGTASLYPDLVLLSQDRGRRLEAVVEVETGESVNHLEALAQWAHFGKLRAAFHLYVPSGMVDVARRLCEDNQVRVNEIWSYHTIGDEVRFTLVHRMREAAPAPVRSRAAAAAAPVRRKPPAAAKPRARAVKSSGRASAPPKKTAGKTAARSQKRK